eukprot:PLAT1233.1.p2 GENE.PLAT1233.1~~PLAT1233.1.p2  ORF type:complete len:172 (-),score=59.50 PLAT1233.1:19-534(-)
MSSRQCAICQAAPPKYRCPRCRIRYCSLPCYRTHVEGGCAASAVAAVDAAAERRRAASAAAAAAAAATAAATAGPDGEPDDDEEDWRLSSEQIAAVAGDAMLASALRDSRLQKLIRSIDGAEDRAAALQAALVRDERFEALLHALLLRMGLREKEEGAPAELPLAWGEHSL